MGFERAESKLELSDAGVDVISAQSMRYFCKTTHARLVYGRGIAAKKENRSGYVRTSCAPSCQSVYQRDGSGNTHLSHPLIQKSSEPGGECFIAGERIRTRKRDGHNAMRDLFTTLSQSGVPSVRRTANLLKFAIACK